MDLWWDEARHNYPTSDAHRLVAMARLELATPVTRGVSAGEVHWVRVGIQGSYSFAPNTTYAAVGDVVTFQFYPTNHSVVRGVYAQSPACSGQDCNPCVPYELIHPGQVGFHSGNIITSEGPSVGAS
jgi:plastocyanin